VKSLRTKILAMLFIVAGGAIVSAVLSFYGLTKSNELNARSSLQGDIALVTERINGLVTGVVMEARGIYMSATPAAAEPFAKGMESRFPQLRSRVADI
jgi:methyl-accepting chemotaxis protein